MTRVWPPEPDDVPAGDRGVLIVSLDRTNEEWAPTADAKLLAETTPSKPLESKATARLPFQPVSSISVDQG